MRPVEEPAPDTILATRRFLLDTNVIRQVIRPKKTVDAGIRRFLNTVDEDRLYISTITLGEIEKGIGLLPEPSALEERLEQLCDRFAGRIVAIDTNVARQWGRLHAERERAGRKTPVVDTLIAACALVHRLVVATADADFASFEQTLTVYNPITHLVRGHRPLG